MNDLRETLRARLRSELGFVPDAIAVMGKWEPFLPARRCLEEVAARAAAALALSEALAPEGPGPYLLSAEAKLRGQPRAGCLLAAEILCALGARPERICCAAAANRTAVELRTLERMRSALGAEGVLMLTAGYHVERARALIEREGLPREQLRVSPCDGALVEAALACLDAERRVALRAAIERGRRAERRLSPLFLNELLARVGARLPLVERLVADLVRGRGDEHAELRLPAGH
jgi:hypothetical protein